jgi:hypothetical protein
MLELFKIPIFTMSERFEELCVFPPGQRRAMFNTKTKTECADKQAIYRARPPQLSGVTMPEFFQNFKWAKCPEPLAAQIIEREQIGLDGADDFTRNEESGENEEASGNGNDDRERPPSSSGGQWAQPQPGA